MGEDGRGRKYVKCITKGNSCIVRGKESNVLALFYGWYI